MGLVVPMKKMLGFGKKLAVGLFRGKRGVFTSWFGGPVHLKNVQNRGRSRTVLAAESTNVWKKVVFVCPAGMESSLHGLKQFKRFASENPPNANLVLDYSGWMLNKRGVFKKGVLSADYVVPMGPGVVEKLKSVIGAKRTQERLIDPKFDTIPDQYVKEKYLAVLDAIKKDLEKEKK